MNSKINQKIIDLGNFAFQMALEIERQSKHVSIILDKRGNMLSYGQNATRTHPKSIRYGYRFAEVHSELDAFIKLPKQYRSFNLILVNYRFNRFGLLRKSRPCVKCMPWCESVFKNIIYTKDDGFYLHHHRGEVLLNPFSLERPRRRRVR